MLQTISLHSLPEIKCSLQSLECSVGVQLSLLIAEIHFLRRSGFLGMLLNFSLSFLCDLLLSQLTALQIDGTLAIAIRSYKWRPRHCVTSHEIHEYH